MEMRRQQGQTEVLNPGCKMLGQYTDNEDLPSGLPNREEERAVRHLLLDSPRLLHTRVFRAVAATRVSYSSSLVSQCRRAARP